MCIAEPSPWPPDPCCSLVFASRLDAPGRPVSVRQEAEYDPLLLFPFVAFLFGFAECLMTAAAGLGCGFHLRGDRRHVAGLRHLVELATLFAHFFRGRYEFVPILLARILLPDFFSQIAHWTITDSEMPCTSTLVPCNADYDGFADGACEARSRQEEENDAWPSSTTTNAEIVHNSVIICVTGTSPPSEYESRRFRYCSPRRRASSNPLCVFDRLPWKLGRSLLESGPVSP